LGGTAPSWLGCSSITFRALRLEAALDRIAEVGFSAIDLGVFPGFCEHYIPDGGDAARRKRVAALVHDRGLAVRAINADPGDLAERQRSRDRLDECMRLASMLETDLVCVPCGDRRAGESVADGIARASGALRDTARRAASRGIRIAVEAPHCRRLCRSVDDALTLMAHIDHPNAFLLLDTSHVMAGGGDPVPTVGSYGERLVHVHLRDARGADPFVVPGEGEVAFPTFFAALADSGYRGATTLELEAPARDGRERMLQVRAACASLAAARDAAKQAAT
jgi:sugar phosphate isomerase/epimerase